MNHQEMIDEVSDQIRDTKSSTRITRWINIVLDEIGAKYVFPVLHKYGTGVTALGNPDVALAADFHLMKHLEFTTDEIIPDPATDSRLFMVDALYRTRQGSISHYYLSGEKQVSFYKVPDGAKNFNYAYQRRITKLPGTNPSGETAELPLEWHAFIVNETLVRAWDYEGNVTQSTKAEQRSKKLLKELKPVLYKNLHLYPVLETQSRMGRLPRPQFPSNFPRIW